MQASAAPGFTAASKYKNIRGFIEIYSVDVSSNLAVFEMVETTEARNLIIDQGVVTSQLAEVT